MEKKLTEHMIEKSTINGSRLMIRRQIRIMNLKLIISIRLL